VLCRLQHVDHHRKHEHRCHHGEDALVERDYREFRQKHAEHDGCQQCDGGAPPDRGQQGGAPGFPQVRSGDGDDEERLDAFAQSDYQHLSHIGAPSVDLP
jgi:hypothetical protein